MSRNEDDLRDALRELGQRAVEQGAPSTASILVQVTGGRPGRPHGSVAARRLAPLAAAAAVVMVMATAVTAVTLRAEHSASSHQRGQQAASQPAARHSAAPSRRPAQTKVPSPVTVLGDAAARLDAAPAWATPDPQAFFYVETTLATTWTSVSGTKAGHGKTANGEDIWVSGCKDGHIVSGGQAGTCTLNDVPHYLGDAPTAPPAWDTYLEQIAPGSRAADTQGKIIVQVLHQDLVAPKAAAALLRYTASCPGLHTLTVAPVAGEKLLGVTCTSMTNGSYALAFDATSHAFVGFVVVTGSGQQDGPAEIVRGTAIVPAIGRTP